MIKLISPEDFCHNCRDFFTDTNKFKFFEDGIVRNICDDCVKKQCVPNRLNFTIDKFGRTHKLTLK